MESILCLLLSAVLLVLGIFQLRGKGVPFNNAYLFASSKERETMNKAPYYRQSSCSSYWGRPSCLLPSPSRCLGRPSFGLGSD